MSEPILQAFEDMFDVLDTTLRAFKGQVEALTAAAVVFILPAACSTRRRSA